MEILICIFVIVLALDFIIQMINNRKKESSNNHNLNESCIENIQSNKKSNPNDDKEEEPTKPVSDNTVPIESEDTREVSLIEGLISQETKYVIPATTGESEFYKEKLQDYRWIEKRNKIKQRDKYVCQHCLNIKSLSSLDELDKFMDDYSEKDGSKIAQVVKQEFKHYIERNINRNGDCAVIFKRKWIPKYQLYQYSLYNQLDYTLGNTKSFCGYLYSNKEITPELISMRHITLTEKIPFKKKDGFGETQSLLVIHSPEATTCGQLLLRALFPLEVYGLEYNGVGQLSLDEYSIFFPLHNLNKFKETLEVHHTKYSQSGLPWDIDDKLLITLCHSCHMDEHN